jgi:beta-carotene hydroxylase
MAISDTKLDRRTLLLLCAQWTLFAGNLAVYFVQPLPLAVHMAVGVLAVHLAFTIWHEAAHGNVSNRRWINNTVGFLGMLPYTTPYFLQRCIHLDHHKHLNEKGLDPNLIYADGPFWQLPLRYLRTVGYARRKLRDDPRSPAMRRSDAFGLVLVLAAYGVALWQGAFLDLLLVWFLPVVIAKGILDWYVNYLPHVGLPPHRFLGTRIVDVAWLTPLVLAHNYHAIHHLWPGIPWHRYRETFHAKLAYLTQHGVPIERRLFGGRIPVSLPSDTGTGRSQAGRRQADAQAPTR